MRYVSGKQTWEIKRVNTTLEIADGKKTTSRKFVTVEQAEAMLAKLVAEKLAAGFTVVDEPPPPPPEPVVEAPTEYPRSIELERAIGVDPYDAGPYLVYADWLQAKGDPRGELIVQMNSGVDVKEYVKAHKRSLFGPLAGRVTPPLDQPPMIWKLGFIHRIELERERHGKDIAPLVTSILDHASGAVVAEAILRSDDEADLSAAIGALVRAAPPLRIVEIASKLPMGDFSELLTTFDKLTRLSIKIRSRRRECPGISPRSLQSIARTAPSSLERLEIRCGTGDATFADIAPLFARTDLARLTHLRIRDARFGDALVDAALAAPFASQLAVLDFGMCDLSLDAVKRLVAAKDRFPALVELWVSRGNMVPAAHALLPQFAKHVVELSREPVDVTLEEISKARYSRGWE